MGVEKDKGERKVDVMLKMGLVKTEKRFSRAASRESLRPCVLHHP